MCLDVTSWGPKEWERYQLLYMYIYIHPHQQELSYKSNSYLCLSNIIIKFQIKNLKKCSGDILFCVSDFITTRSLKQEPEICGHFKQGAPVQFHNKHGSGVWTGEILVGKCLELKNTSSKILTFKSEVHHLFTFVLLLQLHEVDVAVSDMLNPTEMNCDVACLVYDVTNPRTFEFCARMYLVNRDFGIICQSQNVCLRC